MEQQILETGSGTPAPVGVERRKYERKELQAEVNFFDHTNFYTGFSDDISEGGLFLATYTLQPVGTEIDITFELPNGHEVKTRGVVRWVRDPRNANDSDVPPGMGLQFLELADADREQILAFIEARAPMFYDD